MSDLFKGVWGEVNEFKSPWLLLSAITSFHPSWQGMEHTAALIETHRSRVQCVSHQYPLL